MASNNVQQASTTKGGCTFRQPGDLDISAIDRATDDVALNARAFATGAASENATAIPGGFGASDLAVPGHATPGGSSAPSSSTDDAPCDVVADATAHANAPTIVATALLISSARGTKRKASDEICGDLYQLRGKQPGRVRLLTKQHSTLYNAPSERRLSLTAGAAA